MLPSYDNLRVPRLLKFSFYYVIMFGALALLMNLILVHANSV